MQKKMESASPWNLEEMMRIERECFTQEAYTKEQILSLLRDPNAVGLLARIDGDSAGFIIGLVETYGAERVGHVFTIDVAVKYRRMGVGIELLKQMENVFRKKGAGASYLEVRADNHAARRLYRKQGYIEMDSLGDYYSGGVHGLRLKKQLKIQ